MSASLAFWRILETVPRAYSFALLCVTVATSLTEGFSLLLLTPMLGMLYQHTGAPAATDHARGAALSAVERAIQAIGLEGLLICFVLIIAVRSGLQYAKDCMSAALQARVVDGLRARGLRALLNANWRWLAHRRQADDASLLLTEIGRVGVGLQAALTLIAGAVSAASCLAAALILSWELTCVAAVSGGIVFLLMGSQRTSALVLGREWGQSIRKLHGHISEALQGIRIAKIFAAEDAQMQRATDTISASREKQLLFVSRSSRSRGLYQVAAAVLLSAYIYVGIVIWHASLPVILTLVLILGRLTPLFASTHQQLHQWLHAVPAWDDVSALIAESERHAELDVPTTSTNQFDGAVRNEIRLDNISVQYEGRTQSALAEISLSLRAGSTTALTGPSGVGKSTLADVISGLIAPDHGTVRVDGIAVDAEGRRAWRTRVAYVTQDAWFYHGSIRENLCLAAPGADDHMLQRVLRQSSCDFVFALPDGLETSIGDGGTRLSGGERQRLALARALLRRPALLILDEATSALDAENEARVQDAILKIKGSTVILLIGHRGAALEQADQLVTLTRDGLVITDRIEAKLAYTP